MKQHRWADDGSTSWLLLPTLAVLAMLALIVLPGCASSGGVRHVATVSVVSSHAVLSTVDDAEMQLVCGRPMAPAPPRCVSMETHRSISALLAEAYGLEARVARVVRALPAGAPTPAEVADLTVQIAALIDRVLAMLPQSQAKAALVERISTERR